MCQASDPEIQQLVEDNVSEKMASKEMFTAFDITNAIRADGTVTPETLRVIRDFQKRICGFKWPDGRIDPGQRTIRRLLREFVRQGGVVRLDPAQVIGRLVPGSTAVG